MNVDVSLILCTVHVASAANPTHVLLMADANSVWKSKGGTEGLHGPSTVSLLSASPLQEIHGVYTCIYIAGWGLH